MFYLSIRFKPEARYIRYRMMSLDAVYEYLSSTVWSDFVLRTSIPFGFKEEEFEEMKGEMKS